METETKSGLVGFLSQAAHLTPLAAARLERLWEGGEVRFRPEEIARLRAYATEIDDALVPVFQALDRFASIASAPAKETECPTK